MKRVLIFVGTYLPGHRGGGPLRSIANLVEALRQSLDFQIITSDRDIGDDVPYVPIGKGGSLEIGRTRVRYLAPGERGLRKLAALLDSMEYDVLYLNGLFNWLSRRVLMLRKVGLLRPALTIIAPRGELSPGALSIRQWKKVPFLRFSNAAGIYSGVLWQATSELEREEIQLAAERHLIPRNIEVVVARNLVRNITSTLTSSEARYKKRGSARVVFISRITRKKNLAMAILIAGSVEGDITFDIFGPMEDSSYWEKCRSVIQTLPRHIKVTYRGDLNPDQVIPVFCTYHAFLFPSLGENFGHVVMESLVAGCPVLTSDRTPWQDLQNAGAGWALPLDQLDLFVSNLQTIVDLDDEEFQAKSALAKAYASRRVDQSEDVEATYNLFERAICLDADSNGNRHKNCSRLLM